MDRYYGLSDQRMSEATQSRNVLDAIKPLNPQRVENRVGPGTPDINYIEGWLELKWLPGWPENCDRDPVLIHHFTPQQRVWLGVRWRAGGAAYLLLQVGTDWLLFTGEAARAFVGRAPRPVLFEKAIRRWKPLNKNELCRFLSTPRSLKSFF